MVVYDIFKLQHLKCYYNYLPDNLPGYLQNW